MLLKSHFRMDDFSQVLEALGTDDLVAMALHLKGEVVLLLGGYMRPGLGLKGANLIRLRNLAAVISTWTGPWLAYMDWNMPPDELKESEWLSKLNGVLLLPTNTAFTCTAGKMRLLDYVVHSKGLESRVRLDAVPTPWLSHRGLELCFDCSPVELSGWTLQLPRPFEKPAVPKRSADPSSKTSRRKAAAASKRLKEAAEAQCGMQHRVESMTQEWQDDWKDGLADVDGHGIESREAGEGMHVVVDGRSGQQEPDHGRSTHDLAVSDHVHVSPYSYTAVGNWVRASAWQQAEAGDRLLRLPPERGGVGVRFPVLLSTAQTGTPGYGGICGLGGYCCEMAPPG